MKSERVKVINGVPQGTVLGPVLFIVMLNDIVAKTKLSSVLKSFADDTRILRPIQHPIDTSNLQRDLLEIYNWTDYNNMVFNEEKFELLQYGTNRNLKGETNYKGSSGKPVHAVEHVKDLGVTMSNDATFCGHIDKVVSTCKQLIGYILRTYKARDKQSMLTLWKSLVLPKIEYCSQL